MQIDDSRIPPPRPGAFPARESPEPVTGRVSRDRVGRMRYRKEAAGLLDQIESVGKARGQRRHF
jgi:hypothetical protein